MNKYGNSKLKSLRLDVLVSAFGSKTSQKQVHDVSRSVKVDLVEKVHYSVTTNVSSQGGNSQKQVRPLTLIILVNHIFTETRFSLKVEQGSFFSIKMDMGKNSSQILLTNNTGTDSKDSVQVIAQTFMSYKIGRL